MRLVELDSPHPGLCLLAPEPGDRALLVGVQRAPLRLRVDVGQHLPDTCHVSRVSALSVCTSA